MATISNQLHGHSLLRVHTGHLEYLRLDRAHLQSTLLDKKEKVTHLQVDDNCSVRATGNTVSIHRNEDLDTVQTLEVKSGLLDMVLHQGQLWILTAEQEVQVYDCRLGKLVNQIANGRRREHPVTSGRLALASRDGDTVLLLALDNLMLTHSVQSGQWSKYNKAHDKRITHLAASYANDALVVLSYSGDEYLHVHHNDVSLPHRSVPLPRGPALKSLSISEHSLAVCVYDHCLLLSLISPSGHSQTSLSTKHLSILNSSFLDNSLLVAGVLEFQVKCRRLQDVVLPTGLNPALQTQLDCLDCSHLSQESEVARRTLFNEHVAPQHSQLDLMAVQKASQTGRVVEHPVLPAPEMKQSVAVLLGQSLRNNDREMTDYCLLETNEELVRETALRIPAGDLVLVVQTLVDRLTSFPAQQKRLALWMKHVLLFHQSHLVQHPDLFSRLQPLLLSISRRAVHLHKVVSLHNRLSLMLDQPAKKAQEVLEPCVIYQEDSAVVHLKGMEEEESLDKDSFDDSFADSMQEEKEEEGAEQDSDGTEEAFEKAAEYYKNQRAEESSEESEEELDQDFIGLE